ncbi:MAG: hypothetical protein LBV46_04170, partial [Bacteroidales bacterium]|nr:hypothetical protein [Bacteroidales bacterium]
MENKKEEFLDKDHSQGENLEQYINMDIRAGTSQEAVKISENKFLDRGLHEKPDTEQYNCTQYRHNCCKLATYDWIKELDLSPNYLDCPIAEVRFKNSHKDFFLLPEDTFFRVGDIVAVEATQGHDIGIISMLGLAVERQLK